MKKQTINRLAAVAAIALLAGLSAFNIYYHTKVQVSSDTVTMLPVARDFIGGNFLLKHWVLGTNNFFFTETIFYAIGLALGFTEETLIGVITPVFFSMVTVFFAYFFIWKEEDYPLLTAGHRAWMAFLYVLVVGISPWPLAYTLLNANSHNNLYLFIGICFLLLLAWTSRGERWMLAVYFALAVPMVFSEGFAVMTLIAPGALFGLWNALFDECRQDTAADMSGKNAPARAALAVEAASERTTDEKNIDITSDGKFLDGAKPSKTPRWPLFGVRFTKDRVRRMRGLAVFGVNVAAYVLAKILTAIVAAVGGLVTRGLPMRVIPSPMHLVWRVHAFVIDAEKFFDTGKLDYLGLTLPDGVYRAANIIFLCIFLCGLTIALLGVFRLSVIDRLLFFTTFLNLFGCFFFTVDIHVRYLVPTWICGGVVSVKQICRMACALDRKFEILNYNCIKKHGAAAAAAESGATSSAAAAGSRSFAQADPAAGAGSASTSVLTAARSRAAAFSPMIRAFYIFTIICAAVTIVKRTVVVVRNPVYGDNEREVAEYLEKYSYGDGYGVFWTSCNISYYSGDNIDITPTVIDDEGIFKYFELIRDDWYDWDNRDYMVIGTDTREQFEPLLYEYLGQPVSTAVVNDYVIYRWTDDITDELGEYDISKRLEAQEPDSAVIE